MSSVAQTVSQIRLAAHQCQSEIVFLVFRFTLTQLTEPGMLTTSVHIWLTKNYSVFCSVHFLELFFCLFVFLILGERGIRWGWNRMVTRQKNLLTRFTPSFMPSVITKSYLGHLRAKFWTWFWTGSILTFISWDFSPNNLGNTNFRDSEACQPGPLQNFAYLHAQISIIISSCPVVLPIQPVFTSSNFVTPSLPQFCEVPSLHRQAASEQEESTPWDTRNAEGAVQKNSCKMRALFCEVVKDCMGGKGASDRPLLQGLSAATEQEKSSI